MRRNISAPERGPRRWQDERTGETPREKQAVHEALYGNRRRTRRARGVVCNGGVESCWSVRSFTSMRPGDATGVGAGS